MKRLLLRLGLAVLGTALTLMWWSYRDRGASSSAHSMSHLPTKFADGGNLLSISTESSTPATLSISFEDLRKPVGEQILLNATEKIPAGPHTWVVDVPSGVGGYIELEAINPGVDAMIKLRVLLNGKDIGHETDKLTLPLSNGEGFFVTFRYDDFSKAEEVPEDGPSEQ